MEENNQNSIPVVHEKVFSNGILWLAAILGGPLVVGILASENYKVFGEKKNASWVMFGGIFLMITVMVLAYFNIPGGKFSLGYLVGILLAVPQQNKIKEYIKNGGSIGRRWPVSAIIITILLVVFSIMSLTGVSKNENLDNSLPSYIQSAKDNIGKGNYKAAISDFDKIIQTNPSDPKLLASMYGGKANVEYLDGNMMGSEEDYKKSISIYPLKLTYQGLAQIYSDQNKYLLAIDTLNKGIDSDPTDQEEPSNEELLMSIALMYFGLGDNGKVIEITSKIIDSTAPKDSMNAYLNRGYAYSNLNKQELAINDYTSAINIRPTDQAYIARGNAYGILNNKVAACADLKQVKSVPLDPTFKSNHISLTAYCK